jgi:hypothetical protein
LHRRHVLERKQPLNELPENEPKAVHVYHSSSKLACEISFQVPSIRTSPCLRFEITFSFQAFHSKIL